MSQHQYVYGIHAIKALLNSQAQQITKLLFVKSDTDTELKNLIELAQSKAVLCQATSKAEVAKLLDIQSVHQGVIAQCQQFKGFNEADLFALLDAIAQPVILLILDGVQDPHNLGAILRSANAFGVHAVIAPKDRAVGLTPVVHKVACGAASLTPFIQVTNLARSMQALKERGIWLVGMDEHTETDIHEIDLSGNIALVVGNEGQGMRKLTRSHCDFLAKITLPGEIKSLNVSVATACGLYAVACAR